MDSPVRRWVLTTLWLGAVTTALVWGCFRPNIGAASLAISNLAMGLGFAATTVLLRRQDGQRGNSDLFALLTLIWVGGQAGLRGMGYLTALGIWAAGFGIVVAGWVFLRYPGDRLDRNERWFIATCGAILGAVQTGLILTGPPSMWKPSIPDSPWPNPWVAPGVNDVLWFVRYATWAVAGTVFLVLMWRRWRRLGLLERRTLAPIQLTVAFVTLMMIIRLVDDRVPAGVALVIADVRAYSTAAVGVAFAVSALQMKLAGSSITALATELGQSVGPDDVQGALRRALSDPTLEIWYALPDDPGYADTAGVVHSPPTEAPDRLLVPVAATDGRALALISADPTLRRHRSLLDAAVTVSRLAMENAQLQTSLQVQLSAVRDARARLFHTGLEQRRQLERDLHDGAQQRLLAIGMRLGAIEHRSSDPDVIAAVDVARKELNATLHELRDLAHGLYPAVLSQAGLSAAVEAVVERMPVPVSAEVAPGRWDADVEGAAYMITCEALTNACKHAGPCTVRVRIAPCGDELHVEVVDDGVGMVPSRTSLRAIRDRVEAVGGRLHVESAPSRGTTITADLPCG